MTLLSQRKPTRIQRLLYVADLSLPECASKDTVVGVLLFDAESRCVGFVARLLDVQSVGNQDDRLFIEEVLSDICDAAAEGEQTLHAFYKRSIRNFSNTLSLGLIEPVPLYDMLALQRYIEEMLGGRISWSSLPSASCENQSA